VESLSNFLSSDSFMPHGHCYLWRSDILWLNVGSDALIALSYYAIPLSLIRLVRKRQDLAFHWMFVMFAAFILACGTTHLVEILTVWNPQYGLQGLAKLLTAGVSLATAIALQPLLPRILALPSPRQLAKVNQSLEAEVAERRKAEEQLRNLQQDLERLVAERTRELAVANAALQQEIEERKAIEEKLVEQREWFRVTLSSIGDGVIATNILGQIEFINPVAEAMTGWSAKDAIGKSVLDVFDIKNEYTREPVQNPIVRVLREGVIVGLANHTVLISRDGREVSIDDSGAPIRNARGEVVGAVLVFHDIMERKKAESLQAHLAALVESSDDAIVGKDMSGTITSWNKGAERLFGYAAHEVVGKPVTIIFPIDRHADLATILSTIRRGDRIDHYETERVRKDGRKICVSLSVSPIKDQMGNIVGVAKIARDITDRKLAEAKLERWDYIFTNAGWAVGVVNPHDNTFDAVNPAFARLHGCRVHELVGSPAELTVAVEDRPRLRDLIAAVDEHGSYTYELVHQRKDGSTFPVQTTASAFRDADGKVLFRAATVLDISERKRAEERVERAYAKAQRANRLKDEFLATLSHELRTPLNAILGYAEILKDGAGDAVEQTASIDAIYRNARSQNQLIADLLDVSGIISGKLILGSSTLDLAPLVAEAVESVAVGARAKNVTISVDPGEDAYIVAGDAARLRQVVWNLLSNAIKFTPGGGWIKVALRRVDGAVELEIGDSGKGIDPEFLPYVFDRFRQEDSSSTRRFGGLGLGLAIVRHIVELHGGSVQALSDGKDQGAKFTVSLPVAAIGSVP
jgi:PAS domain S-box-containing protein